MAAVVDMKVCGLTIFSPLLSPAIGMPEYSARRFFLQVEQIQLRPQLAMIPLLRFLEPVQMFLKLHFG